MKQKNLMHINAQSLATLDTLYEYQRLFINDKVGAMPADIYKIKRDEMLRLTFDNIDDVWATLEKWFEFYSISQYRGMIIQNQFIALLTWNYDSTHTGIYLSLSSSSLQETKQYINDIKKTLREFLVTQKSVNYTILQNENGSIDETMYQETLDVAFTSLAVPFIQNVDIFIENYLDAKAPLLILYGTPGTGKTTFVKYILQTMQQKILQLRDKFKVTYSFDEEIFYTSDFYKQLICDDYDVQVYEDVNQILYKNQDDGEMNPINKFLSVTDGLVSKYKKIIITTNIESKSQLNPALLRPGRCFDVMEFRNLKGKEIDTLRDNCAKDLILQTDSISLSEFYAKKDGMNHTKIGSAKIGF